MSTYHIVLSSHPTGGQPIQDDLCATFGNQGALDPATETWIAIDCNATEIFLEAHAELSAYVPSSYPMWMTDIATDPSNCTHEEALLIVTTSEWTGE